MKHFGICLLLTLHSISMVIAMGSNDMLVDSLKATANFHFDNSNLPALFATYDTLGMIYYAEENFPESAIYYKKALEVARQLEDFKSIAKNLHDVGLSQERANNYQEALEYYFELTEMESQLVPRKIQAKGFRQLSSIYQAMGNYEKAFDFQMRALQISEIENDSIGVANSYYVVGTIFFYQKRYDSALDYYQKAYDICLALQLQTSIYSCLAAIGSAYDKLNENDKSLDYTRQSLLLAKKLKYKTGIAYSQGNLGSLYLQKKDFERALRYNKKALALKIELNDSWGAIGSHLGIAETFVDWRKPHMAIIESQKALKKAQQINAKPRILEAYQLLSSVYKMINKTDSAFYFQNQYIALNDSLLNEKTVEQMGQSKKRYELQKKEHEIVVLKKENKLLEQNQKIKQLQVYIFVAVLLILLLFLAWSVSRYRLQQRMNDLLEDKNELLESKNQEINHKNEQLKDSNEELEQFAYVASHDLKQPLRMISSYSTLIERRYKDLLDDTGKEFLFYVVDAVHQMQTLLDDLLSYSRVGSEAAIKKIDTADILFIVSSNLRLQFEEVNGQLIIEEKNLPVVEANQSQLTQLFQNLISNAVKFTGDKTPVVKVDCTKQEDEYIFSIQDNGIGISPTNQKKIFEMFRRLHSKEEYDGTGIGLATCKRIVKNLNGKIWVESEEGLGSTFFFSMPCPIAEPALLEVS